MSRPFAPRTPPGPTYRINGKIRAREVRVIGPSGQALGVIGLAEALNLARQHAVDLVEIAPNAVPPVCRLVDFGKFRYEQSKKDKDSKKHQHTNKVKEMIEDWRAEAEEDWKAEGEADTDVDAILNERGSNYGSFKDVAGFAQEMKNAIRMCNNSELDDDQIEALDMIASKIARIVNGNPNHLDSWIDIAGYATLVADRIQGKIR